MSEQIVSTVSDEEAEQGLLTRLAALGARVADLRSTDAWQRWLATASKFHRYSFGNQLLIAVQRPDATQVAGYRKWQELGRQVMKGERGIRIFAPMSRKREVDGETKNVLVGFKVVSVFDVSQTEGEALPEAPAWPFAGGEPDVLLDDVIQQVTAQGYDVSITSFEGGARGWCVPSSKSITLCEGGGLGQVEMLAVLLHELGHCFDPDVTTDHSRADKELVAESVAWVVGTGLGLTMDAQVEHYLASWGGTDVELLRVARRIGKAVQSINELLAASVSVEAEEAA